MKKQMTSCILLWALMCLAASADTISVTQHVVKVAVPATDYEAANKLYVDQRDASSFTNLVLTNTAISASYVANGTLHLGTNAPPVGTPAIWASTGSLYWVADGVPVGYVNTNGIVLEQGTLQLYEQDLDCNVRLYDGSRIAPSLTFAGHTNAWGMYAYGYNGSYGAGWSQAGVAIGTLYGGGIALLSSNAAFRGPVVGDLSGGTNYPEYHFMSWSNSLSTDLTNHINTTIGYAHPVTGDLNMKGYAVSNTAQLQIGYTGTWLYNYPMLCGPDGKSMLGGFTYNEQSLSGFLTSLTFTNLETVGGAFNPTYMPSITSLSAPKLRTIGGACSPYSLQALQNWNMDEVHDIGGACSPYSLNSLTNWTMSGVRTIGGACSPASIYSLSSWVFGNLKTIGGSCQPSTMPALTLWSMNEVEFIGGACTPNSMGALTIWTMDKLQTVNGACSPATMNSLTTWQRPALRTINGSVNFVSMTNLTSVVATNIVSINGYVYLRGVVDTLGGLTNINIGTVGVTTNLAGSWLFSSNKLTIASCSNNLAVLDSLNGTSNKQYWGTSMIYNVVGNTNAPLSAWSPIMYTWKTNIQNRGGTVLATP